MSVSHFLTSSEELKELVFFKNTNWDNVLQRKASVSRKVWFGFLKLTKTFLYVSGYNRVLCFVNIFGVVPAITKLCGFSFFPPLPLLPPTSLSPSPSSFLPSLPLLHSLLPPSFPPPPSSFPPPPPLPPPPSFPPPTSLSPPPSSFLLQMTPPLIPPRGEVNAADAFDIGNFDDDETKGVKVSQSPVLSVSQSVCLSVL